MEKPNSHKQSTLPTVKINFIPGKTNVNESALLLRHWCSKLETLQQLDKSLTTEPSN